MVIIMAEDLAKFSDEHFIVAAEAGVKANVESTAAAISILISDLSWENTSEVLAIGIRIFYPVRFRKKTFLCAALYAAMQRAGPARSMAPSQMRASPLLRFRPLGDAAGCDFRVARRLAASLGLTPVDAAGEAIDQPRGFVAWAFDADVAGPQC